MKTISFASCLAAIVLLAFAGLAGGAQGKAPSLVMEPPFSKSNDDGFWQRAPIDGEVIRPEVLSQHLQLCIDTGADSQEPLGAMSSTKVIASILVGQLVDQGRLSYTTRLSEVLPEWTGGLLDRVTIEELLTHTAGFRRRVAKDDSIGFAENKRTFVLGLYPDYEPGLKYEYSNEGVQLLEPVLARLTGRDTPAKAKDLLFQRLGMRDTSLHAYGDSAWNTPESQATEAAPKPAFAPRTRQWR